MRGVSPSQTLPDAGGQPPTPPGSVSPLHHDQRPALDPLIHRAEIHKTNSQISSSRRRPGPTQRPIAIPCTKPYVPGQICKHTLQAQPIAAGKPGAALHGSVPHTLRAAPDRSRTPASARPTHAATPADLRGTPAGAPSRLVPHTLGAPGYHSQTTLAPRKTRTGPLRLDSSHAPDRSYLSSRTTRTPAVPRTGRHRRTQNRTQSLSEPRTDPIRYRTPPRTPNHRLPHTQRRQETARTRRPAYRQTSRPPDQPPTRTPAGAPSRLVPRTLGARLALGGPALHPRPRFARPRPQLGPPYHRVQSDSVRCDNRGVRILSACNAE